MKKSKLVPIVNRLEAMIQDETGERQVRRFEVNERERCLVTYDNARDMFELEDRTNGQVYEFDDIDFVIKAAHKEGKWAGMCGEVAGDQRGGR